MKIGYLVQQFYPTAYGSGVHAFELARELTKLGNEVHVITKGEPFQCNYEMINSIHVHRVLNFIKTPYYFPLNSVLLWLCGRKIIRKLDLDVLLGHGFESSIYFNMNEKIPFIYKAAGTIGIQKSRKIVTWHDIFGKLFFSLLARLEKTAVHQADFVIAVSNTIKRELTTMYNVPGQKIYRIYNGVNIKRFHPLNNKNALKRELGLDFKTIVLFVGRLSSIKGPQILLQAIPSIIKKFPDCIFLFLGEGPLSRYLHYLTRKLHVTGNVIFRGFISNIEIPKYFAIADICVIPSLYEPFGLVALESLSSGTPILSSVQGGLAEIHNFLRDFPKITPLTPDVLSKRLNILLSNPEQLKYLAKTGREMVSENFNWTQCALKTDRVLKILKERRRK